MKNDMKSAEALAWVIGFIEANDIPYLICGGLAARAYGSMRPLHDIDLYVPAIHYETVVEFGQKYTTYGPNA